MTESNRKFIIDATTRYLARREHSMQELITKLEQKGFDSEEFIAVLEEFKQADIQSDARYAEMRIRSSAARGVGPRRIKAELAQHGIAKSVTEWAMTEADIDWFAVALAVKKKKYGGANETDFRLSQKQMQFLNYRGFTHEQIDYAVNGG